MLQPDRRLPARFFFYDDTHDLAGLDNKLELAVDVVARRLLGPGSHLTGVREERREGRERQSVIH